MKTLIPIRTTTPPRTLPRPHPAVAPAPTPAMPSHPEPAAPGQSASLRDSLGEAQRAEEIARQERERAAMRQPVGLD